MKNKRLICLILALSLALPVGTFAEEEAYETAQNAAEEASLASGTYVGEDGAPISASLALSVGEKRYMPVADILAALEYEVYTKEMSVAANGVLMTADSYRIEKDGAIKIAPLPPIFENGVLYAPEIVMNEIFGITAKEQKDGTIKVSKAAEEGETAVVDDSWYDEWLATRPPEPEKEELTTSQLLRKNFQKSLYIDTDISNILSLMNDKGMFTDIDYKDTNLTSWKPGSHVSRLGTIAKAVYNPENKHYMSEEALTKLELGIKYWFDNNFVSQNWWWNDRGIPDYFMTVAAFDPEIDPKYKKLLDEKVKEQPGGSFTWDRSGKGSDSDIRPWNHGEAGVPIQTAFNEMIALKHPDEVIEPWLRDIVDAVSYEYTNMPFPLNFNKTGKSNNTDQHMRGDYGYTCHTFQNLIATYGIGPLERMVEYVLDYTEGMGLKLTDEAAEEITKYLTDGMRYYCFNNYWQNTVLGRGAGQAGHNYKQPEFNRRIFRSIGWRFLYEYPNVTRKAELLWFLNSLNDPEYVTQFTGNKMFWQTDFLSHNRPDYQFGLHAVSERSKKPESVLNINRKGLYLGDGAYNLLKRGGEYDGIQPYRDWNKISGTTAELGQENLAPAAMGTTSFVGGATDGLYGFQVFDYDFRNVLAKKSWFCFDDEIVCLGAGITAKGDGDIYTTMNQTNLYGDILTDKGKVETGVHNMEGVRWVLHDGVGYVIDGNETVNIENVERTGAWSEIDLDSGKPDPVTGSVFITGINHGKKPVDASYCYTLLPQTDEEGIKEYAKKPKIEIVSNTKDIQAVYHKDLKIFMAGFYTAGSVSGGGLTVTVDKPCVVMVRQQGKDYTVSCAYPNNVAAKINVNVTGSVNATLLFDLVEGFRGNDAGRTLIYDSKTNEYAFVIHKTNPITITEPAELYAIAIDDEVMESFSSKKFIYTLNVEEIPDVKAKGNFPVKIEHREKSTAVIVEDPSNPDNNIRYIINYNFINKDKE